ncbi:MAG: primosomal protein N' [Alphaproteobacteria bacterium]|nr:primosomal protein N' [Alphaproteobacteria bacterium]
MQQISVLFPTPLGCYDYLSDTQLEVGTFVLAPFGKKKLIGIVWDKEPNTHIEKSKIKQILEILPFRPLPFETIQFVNWVSSYTLAPLGAVLKMALLTDFEKISKKPLIFQHPNPTHISLTFSQAQQNAIQIMTDQLERGFSVSLLDGVTGSGKTEVYFEALAQALKKDGQILVLLPEITLTTAWLERFEKRFGVKPALWHSGITQKQRRDTWNAILKGDAKVIVGARSALFLPYQKLNLIIVDEEHDSSFKQEDGVLYQARDMAVVRAKIAKCPIVLASATPSIESYCNVLAGKYIHIELPERFAGSCLPDIRLVDMRKKEKGPIQFISPELQLLIRENLHKKEQTLLFLNRRGYAPLLLCRSCGERIKCPHCTAWLVEHRKKNILQCHHCGYVMRIPKKCPTCEQEETLVSCGPGVERIHEEAHQLFPEASLSMVTSDTLNNPKEFEALLEKIKNNEIDILIGTQILAKGHHFSNLTLVGVIDADMGLSGGDLRAGERTFQLLHQVTGRAGREQKKGTAVLQTYVPDNLVIQSLQKNDKNTFIQEEIATRQILSMPPFGQLAAIILSGKNEQFVVEVGKKIVAAAPFLEGLDVLGPTPAPLALLRGKFRYRLLIKATKDIKLQNILNIWLAKVAIHSSVSVRIDINPYSFF